MCPLASVLAELGWKPEVLARRLNDVAALHGRGERVHVKTPYKWLRGDRPRSPWPALAAALMADELGRAITAAGSARPGQTPWPSPGRTRPSPCGTARTTTG
jgi:hypothetical protein